ncbi:Nimrod B2 [Carabus blaptoides fortunei]
MFVNTSIICSNTKLVTKHGQESYKVTFLKLVERKCGFFRWSTCIEPRKYYVINYKNVPYNITVKYKECCSNCEWIDDKKKLCKPKYTEHCGQAQCTETDTCICDSHYVTLNDSMCIPTVCIACCNGGLCTEPNVCQCNFNSAQPANTTNSLRLCKDGFKMNDSGICESIRAPECVNSECTVPDNCTCSPGLQTTETSNSSTTCVDDCIQEQNMTQICENEDDLQYCLWEAISVKCLVRCAVKPKCKFNAFTTELGTSTSSDSKH